MKNIDGININEFHKAFDTFEMLRKNPERYLSSSTITALQDFINGYLTGNPYPDDEPPFWDFDNYLLLVTNFELKGGNKNLISRILLNECNGNEFRSFERFFEYLEQYKNKK